MKEKIYKTYGILIFLIFMLVLIDQITKTFILNNIEIFSNKVIISNFFTITYHANFGAAFGILQGKRILFMIVTVAVLIWMLCEMRKYFFNKFELCSFVLIIGGMMGNFLDRLRLGYVVDFLDFTIFGYDYPIFNLADSFMVIGIFLLFICTIKGGKKDESIKRTNWN